MSDRQSLSADYFEGMFSDTEDPWDLTSSPYEAQKFAATVQALNGRRYPRAFEVGCATGVLTVKLAPLCAELLAVDISPSAVRRARTRCAGLAHVRVEELAFPAMTPGRREVFDLIVLSEVAYYWSKSDLARAADWVGSALAEGGDLLLVHWLGDTDYPQSGDGAVEMLAAHLEDQVQAVVTRRTADYRLDVWRRA